MSRPALVKKPTTIAVSAPATLPCEKVEMKTGPIIAAILYLMPMYAIHKVPALARYRGAASNVFVTVAGLIAISAILYGLF